jgi:secreted trypsin-like serine protease
MRIVTKRGAATAGLTALLLVPMVVVGLSVGAGPARAIAHGENAAKDRYRFSVKLTMTGIPTEGGGRRDSFCSGALIDPHWVITAGHCFRDAGGERVERTVARTTTATIGRTDLSGKAGHVATVVEVRQSATADVALAKIDTAIADIAPLRVAPAPPSDGDIVRLTGYGFTTNDESTPARRLQTGTFVVTSVGDSVIGMSGRSPRPETSACLHDSGGPYFTTRPGGDAELVAVVSRGPACPHAGPDLSARVDNIAGWISETTGPRGGKLAGVPIRAILLVAVLLLGGLGALGWALRPQRRAAIGRATAGRS